MSDEIKENLNSNEENNKNQNDDKNKLKQDKVETKNNEETIEKASNEAIKESSKEAQKEPSKEDKKEISKEVSKEDKKETLKEGTKGTSKEVQKESKSENKEEYKKSFARELLEWIICIVIAFVLALLIKYFLFTPTLVMQESMTPTILNGERVLINRLYRAFNLEMKRGDIITFEAPVLGSTLDGEDDLTAEYQEVDGLFDKFLYYVMEVGKTSYIKRIIGLPGDHIEIKNGNVYVNEELLEEDYLVDGLKTYIADGGITNDFVVPEGYIFAMGDNRSGSSDCRIFGCIPKDKVEGKVSIRVWPLNKFGKIDK